MEILSISKTDNILPENLKISITNDQSEQTRMQIDNLETASFSELYWSYWLAFLFRSS